MYLAPLNYDRFFKKVFSDLDIASRFFEDFLDIKIEKLEFLPNKHSVTNDAQIVEFDFHCKTANEHFIIEMQQWYKHDVVQRFYVYHALGSALQLEKMPLKIIPLPNGKTKKIKDYGELLPTITIIWMVHDTLNFTDDYISYVLTPEYITTFLQDSIQWTRENCQMILDKRNEMNKLLTNTAKNIEFLKKNKLIYVFQKNIVKNGNLSKYYDWFEFAQKTLDKVADRFAYDKYRKDKIFCEIIRRLETGLAEDDSMEYIKNYEEYQEGVERYNRGIEKKQQERYEKEILEAKAREEKAKARAEEAKKKQKEVEQKLSKIIVNLYNTGMDINDIAKMTGESAEVIKQLIDNK
ncbi:MAG: hypothetical protein CSA15_04595 [Candidatus Delongbacteria bacterium]|nr:MAG: hypothetical protein CSA15_04595 [Candidatus Delongbacteria bacterium]